MARAERTALGLAAELLPTISNGLTESAGDRICGALLGALDIEAVAVNGPERILASWGEGMDHHEPGGPYRTSAVGRAIAQRQPVTARTSRQIGCAVVGCPLTAGVVAPIVVDAEVIGVISGWRTGRRPVGRATIEAITGLAALFSARLADVAATETPQLVRSGASLRSGR